MTTKTTKQRMFIVCILLLVLPSGVAALDPHRAVTQYKIDAWNDENGLSQNWVHAVLHTRDGYLWLGTEEGLDRFDGVDFTIFDSDNTPALAGNYINTLYQDSRGALWIGSRSGGLAVYRDGRFRRFTTADGFAAETVYCITEHPEGTLWIGCPDGVLYRRRDNAFTVYGEKEGLPKSIIRWFAPGRGDHLWVTTRNGLYLFKDNAFTRRRIKPGDANAEFVRSALADSGNTLWVGTNNGLYHLRDGKITPTRLNAEYPGVRVLSLFEDRDKNIWIGTISRGLFRYREGRYENLTKKTGLSDNAIYSICEDPEGSLWLGTVYGGLNRLRNGKAIPLSTREGLSDDVVFAVYEDRDGYMWLGGNNGVNRLKGLDIRHFTTKDGLTNNIVNAVVQDRDGYIWVGTDNGLNRLHNTPARIVKRRDYPGLYVLTLCEDAAGNLWVGTNTGLFKKSANATRLVKVEKPAFTHVAVILEDSKKNLWLSNHRHGVTRMGNGTVSVYGEADGLAGNTVNCFYEDSQGVLWIGATSGLSRFQNGRFTNYTRKEGLFNNNVYHIREDGRGNFWFSCNKGVFRVARKDLTRFAEGRITSFQSDVFGKADGMLTNECNGGMQSCGWKSRDGRLWFPTTRGAVIFDPGTMNPNPRIPPVTIEHVRLDGQPVDHRAAVAIQPGVKRLEIHYAGLSFRNPEKVRFKYRMEGYENDWFDAGGRRTASYTNLDAGSYRFRVIACNDDGLWNETGAAVALRVIPPLWRTWWFMSLALMVFAVLSYVVIGFFKKYIALAAFWKKEKYMGQFKLLEKIGSGGMGAVYRARNVTDKTDIVAVKVLREELFEDENSRKRFKQEAVIVDQLDHPNIVKVYERGQTRKTMFIAMEMLEGRTLTQRLDEDGRLDVVEGLHIMLQMTDAIAKIHSKSIIHRDMKPDNVMLVQQGGDCNFVKLLDFGLARMENQTRLTQSGMVIGTINYMAPEQVSGRDFSDATDIYSMGVMFYEMMTGTRPFDGETTVNIMRQIVNSDPIEPLQFRFDIPTELNELIMHMIEKEDEERPDVDEVWETLDRIYTHLTSD